MTKSHTELYLHLVWGTHRRRPMLTRPVQELVYGAIRALCAEMRVSLIAVGGVEDHVHLLVRTRASIPVSALVKRLKGATSRLVSLETGAPFRWQRGYGAFTVRTSGVERVRRYILGQERHHARARSRGRSGRPPLAPAPDRAG